MATGLPEVDSITTYGSAKSNFAPVEDSTTDISADEWNLIAMNVAGMTQTMPRAICRFTSNSTSAPTDPASGVHFAVWGNGSGVKPTVAYSTTGTYTITWATTVTDALNVVHTTTLYTGWGNAESSTFYNVQVKMTSVNVATVYVTDAAGAAVNTTGVTFAVFVR